MTKKLVLITLIICASVSCFSQLLEFKNESPYSVEYKIWRNSVVESEGTLKPNESVATCSGRIAFQLKYMIDQRYKASPIGKISYKTLPGNWFEFEILHYGDKTFFIRHPKVELKKA